MIEENQLRAYVNSEQELDVLQIACVDLSLEKVRRCWLDCRIRRIRASLRRFDGTATISWVAADEGMSTSVVDVLERVESTVMR